MDGLSQKVLWVAPCRGKLGTGVQPGVVFLGGPRNFTGSLGNPVGWNNRVFTFFLPPNFLKKGAGVVFPKCVLSRGKTHRGNVSGDGPKIIYQSPGGENQGCITTRGSGGFFERVWAPIFRGSKKGLCHIWETWSRENLRGDE